jgi:uncharacterized membrane protein YoaK (UPF0700 family)
MIRYRRRYWALAAALSAVAGFVDSVAFVELGGYFVSFMSGNSTRLGVGLALDWSHAAIAASLIGSFIGGVILGAFANHKGDKAGSLRVLVMVTAALACAALLADMHAKAAAIGLLAMSMGAVNSVFLRDGEVSIGVTYMTGTLVRFGQRIAGAMMGGPRFAWAPYLLLWLGLILGAVAGAASHAAFGMNAIWFAATALVLIALTFNVITTD